MAWVTERFPNAPAFYHQVVQQSATSSVTDPKWTLFLETDGAGTAQAVYQPRWHGHHSPSAVLETYRTGLQVEGPLEIYFVPYLYVSQQELVFVAHLATDPNEVCYLSYVVQTPGGIEDEGVRSISIPPTTSFEELLMTVGFPRWTSSTTCAVTLLRDGLPVDDTGGVQLRSGNCLQLTISIADWHQLARDLTLIGVTPTTSRSEAAEAESTSLLQIGVHRRKFPLLLAPHLDTETNHKVVQFPLDLHHVTSFLGAWQQMPLNQPDAIPEEVELKSITREALHLQARPNQERHTHIFTDGSFDATAGTMAWSFVVIETGTSDYTPAELKECLGFACGLVDTDHLSPNWKGAERANAYVAEMEALLQAQWWSISNNTGKSVHFHFDAQSAGYAAGGQWGYDPTHKLCVLTRVIAQCLELYTPSTPQYHYVQAHAGDPWNELADTVANACRGGFLPPTHTPAFDFRPLLMGSYVLPVEHLPLTLQVLNGHTSLPSGTGHQLHFESSLGKPATSAALWPLDIQDHCTSTTTTTTMTATLRCGTYNVRTLREERTLPPTGAAEYLRTQLTLLQYHVCALQETRAKESTMIEASDFIRLIAAGEGGQGGCELWFSKQQSFGGHERCGVQHLTVLHQEPSLLVVRQRISNDFVIYVNVHAPHSGHSEETRNQWWAKLQGVLDHVRHRGRIILLGDFNAQLGESMPNVVGDLIDGKTTSNGHKLGELLMRHDLWMPSTYRHCHSGPIGTWIHPKAKTAIRIDYIALDSRLAAYNVISEVEHHLDSPGLGEDHYPVRLDFSFVVRHTTGKRKRALIDEVALGDPQHRARVTQILQQLPTIPWNENVHDHYASIASVLHQQLSDAFPQQRKQPRKHYISQATWLCRSSKLALKKALSAARKRKDEVTEALLLQQLQGASNQLRRQLQADRQNHVELLFDQIDKVPHNQLFAQLQRLGIGARFKKTARTLPMMKKENGEYATSYEESQQVWRQHASALEGGRNIAGVELLHQCEARQRDQLRDGLCPHGLHIPTRVQVERACRKLRPFKARGPDGLPAGLYHHFPEVMAQLLHPLLVKMSCLGAEPLGFKGGRLVHLYKGKGAQDEVANRRGILISNHASKIAHGVLRGQYTPFLEAGMLPMQVGGRAHKSVQQGAHMLRLFMDTCKQQNLACGVVFLDIKTAYYKVLRELVATIHAPEERLRALIDTFNLPSEALQELESKLKASTPIAAQLGTNPYMTSMLGELHSDTWFSTQGLDGVTVTTIGTRPGSCFADILFNILFAAVLKETKEQLGELGVMTDLQWNGLKSLIMDNTDHAQEVTIVEAAWADDLALFFQHSDPEILIANVQEGSTVLLNNCMRYGLEPNFSAGKTEALVSLRGRGATKARRKWFTDHHGLLPLPSCLLPDCCIKMVARYKHLGGVVDAKAKSTPEVRARVGQMRQAFRKYRKTLFVVPSISRSKRAQLLRPFVLSILEYNLGTLTGLQDGDRQYIATALLSIYKQIMKGDHTDDHKFAWPRLCYALQLPTPTAIVYMAQLRYFSQIYRHGDEALWALISTQGQWLISCQEAFQWLYQQVENTTTLPDPLVDWEPWGHLLSQRPKRFAGLIQRAWKHEVIHQYNKLVVQEGFAGFAKALELGNYEFPDHIFLEEDTVDQQPTTTHACLRCRRVFGSRTAWASHAFKCHQRVNSARRFAEGTYCMSCGTEYWEYKRLLLHLRYSDRCRRNLAMAQLEVEITPGLGSREQRRQPEELLKPWTTTPTVGLPVYDYWAGVGAQWDEALLTELFTHLPLDEDQIHISIDTLIDQFRNLLLDTVVEYCTVQATIQCWRESMMDVASESGRERASLIRAFFVVLGQIQLRDWLLPPQPIVKDLHTKDWQTIFEGPLALHNGWPRENPPSPWYKTMFVIHFFSGRRRPNDLQSFLEKIPCPAGIHLCILSADIIFGEGADLARKEVQQRWLEWMALGYVLAFFAGPPCETYSIARSHDIPGVRIRPVRSNREPRLAYHSGRQHRF